LEVNDSFLNLYRGLRQDVINRTSNELNLWVDPRDRNQMTQTLRTEGFVFNQEYQFQNRFGDRKTVLFSAETIILDGQTCILSVVNDITERKQAEEALRESEGRFHALVEQAADAFFVVDAAGKILDVNQQACRNLGYDHEELLTLSVLDIQQDVPMTDLAELWQQLQPGAPITVTGTHRRKDGSLFPVEVRIGLFEVSGQQYILALARDVTERKQAEQALERLAEIGELAAMIVHEVRNPLTTVWMGLNSFKSLELSPRSQARLNLALEESERLQRLLNEILLYARQQTLDLQPVELVAWITDLLPALQEMPSACDRPIQFSSKSDAAWIRADTDKLKQVFINLISNACEAISPQEQVIWTVQTTNRQAHIQIYNSGDPIPADLLAKLTQPFFTTKSSGNGLGLAITKRIVEAHGGEFAIASSAALQGTQVTVYLPLTDPEA
jgi:PAS domain S-box-containing protein